MVLLYKPFLHQELRHAKAAVSWVQVFRRSIRLAYPVIEGSVVLKHFISVLYVQCGIFKRSAGVPICMSNSYLISTCRNLILIHQHTRRHIPLPANFYIIHRLPFYGYAYRNTYLGDDFTEMQESRSRNCYFGTPIRFHVEHEDMANDLAL